MSHNEKSPHQSPVHDTRESQPGLDSLAPSDGSHRPTPEPTPPGAQPTAPGSLKAPETANDKLTALDAFRKGSENYALTTNQGVRIADDQNSLRAGSRGPTLLEDFILREKITHFDHERIPERIVHARGSAAHGYFQPYKDLSDITKAAFLCDPQKITPVFVRFSTVQGGAGSADTVRDIRGFATKFYTEEGIFDLVGNNTPIFLSRMRISFRILCTPLSPNHIGLFRKDRARTTPSGTMFPYSLRRCTTSCGQCRIAVFHAVIGRWKGSAFTPSV